jgi:hypothetical protein
MTAANQCQRSSNQLFHLKPSAGHTEARGEHGKVYHVSGNYSPSSGFNSTTGRVRFVVY